MEMTETPTLPILVKIIFRKNCSVCEFSVQPGAQTRAVKVQPLLQGHYEILFLEVIIPTNTNVFLVTMSGIDFLNNVGFFCTSVVSLYKKENFQIMLLGATGCMETSRLSDSDGYQATCVK